MSSKIVNDTMDAWDWDTVRDLLFAIKPFLTRDELGKKHGVRNMQFDEAIAVTLNKFLSHHYHGLKRVSNNHRFLRILSLSRLPDSGVRK